MPKFLLAFVSAFLLIAAPCLSPAAPLKTYVAEFNVVGAPNRDELKVTLQGLLASRLNPDQVQLVEKPDKAELLLAGSYALFGKMFSIDVLLKNAASGSLTKVFEQGESQDDLIPAFGRLAQKLDRELAKAQSAAAVPAVPTASPLPIPVPVPVVAKSAAPAAAYKVEAPVEGSYVVKSGAPAANTPGYWTSDPMAGVFTSIALGRTFPSGEREIFVAGEHAIRCLRKGTELKQVAELDVPVPARVLSIDTADLDHDGIPELYVSIIDRKSVSSRVYRPSETGLELIADNQPWLYRGIGLDFKQRTVFVQGVSSTGDYQNGVAELSKTGTRFETKTSQTLPRPGNIFNFSRFRDASGADRYVIVDEDGYLSVHAPDGSQLWKGSDKFGGSEMYFNYESVAQLRSRGTKYSWNFLEQRISALPDGTLIIPRNEGTLNIGNSRTYSKHSLFGLQWSGSKLMEAWRTRQTPSYLADYACDPAAREVLLLEVVQHAGLVSQGKTVISINRLD